MDGWGGSRNSRIWNDLAEVLRLLLLGPALDLLLEVEVLVDESSGSPSRDAEDEKGGKEVSNEERGCDASRRREKGTNLAW